MEKWYKLETNKSLNPCVCGCERRAYFRKGEIVYIKCVKCLMTATGKGEEEAEEAWQKITKGSEKVEQGREGTDHSEAKKSGGRTKKGVPRKSLS